MRAFYSDTFVLPLPEHHRFPMAKYRLLRERLVEERVLDPSDLHVPDPVSIDELCLAHDPAYVDAVVRGALSPEMQRRIGFPWSDMMVERSRRSAGGTLAAARDARAEHTMRSATAAKATASSTMWRSPHGCCCATARSRGRSSSIAMYIRAMARRRSSAAIRPCSRCRSTARRTFLSEKSSAIATSRSKTAPATTSTSARSGPTCPTC